MLCSTHQAAIERHAQLLTEAKVARLHRTQEMVVLELRLPSLRRRGLRVALLRLLLWPNRLEIHL